MKNTLLLGLCAVMLSACGGTLFGDRRSPDEMSVVDAPPLSLPPSFELRPPVKGSEIQKGEKSSKKAENLIFGETGEIKTTTDSEDSWLLDKAGASERDPEIRERLKMEQAQEKDLEQMLLEDVKSEPIKVKKKGWFSRTFGSKKETDSLLLEENLGDVENENIDSSSVQVQKPQE